jgi:hypothetical protein
LKAPSLFDWTPLQCGRTDKASLRYILELGV